MLLVKLVFISSSSCCCLIDRMRNVNASMTMVMMLRDVSMMPHMLRSMWVVMSVAGMWQIVLPRVLVICSCPGGVAMLSCCGVRVWRRVWSPAWLSSWVSRESIMWMLCGVMEE